VTCWFENGFPIFQHLFTLGASAGKSGRLAEALLQTSYTKKAALCAWQWGPRALLFVERQKTPMEKFTPGNALPGVAIESASRRVELA